MNCQKAKTLIRTSSLVIFALGFVSLNAQKPPEFRDITHEAGIHFRYTFGDTHYENILESSGSGMTIFDFDGDQWMDIYMLNGTYLEGISDAEGVVFKNTPNHLYRNLGNGKFEEMGQIAGIDDRNWSMAAGAFDYDLDGDQDLFLLNYGPNRFFRNNGDGTFSDITQRLGLQGPDQLNGFTKWSVGAAFADYNCNGQLDLMVGNFLAFDPAYKTPDNPDMMPHPSEYKGQASLLYQQEADGTFSEITREAGLYFPDSKCMGLTFYDFDQDGDLDLFQGNDHQHNFMFQNEGSGKFREVAVRSGVSVNSQGVPTGSMHGTIGDVDGDGLIDLLVTDLKYGALYRNMGNGFYTDITESSGIATHFAGKGQWSSFFFDYDNDGDLDLFAANGTAEELILQYPLLMENNGKGVFINVGFDRSPYFKEKRSGRGAAVLDFDNDGDLDIMVSHIDLKMTPSLLRNDGGNRNNWIGITLMGTQGAAFAVGATVSLETENQRQVKVNQWANSYLSSSDQRLHFGIGKSKVIKKLTIDWPCGQTESYTDISANQYIVIKEREGLVPVQIH